MSTDKTQSVKLTGKRLNKTQRLRERGIVRQDQLGRGFQCNWCKRILQNENGLTRHKHFCGFSPAMKINCK